MIALRVTVPVASFRAPWAREYLESLACPPPSTVYGMLLSLVGEEDMERHVGTELAVGQLSKPERSVVLRTTWRIKSKKDAPGKNNNRTPDFQELLTGTSLVVLVRQGKDAATPSLVDRIKLALTEPEKIQRYGALCLGESTHLVDEITLIDPLPMIVKAEWLIPDDTGQFSLPVRVDHIGSKGTIWGQYNLVTSTLDTSNLERYWIRIPARGAITA